MPGFCPTTLLSDSGEPPPGLPSSRLPQGSLQRPLRHGLKMEKVEPPNFKLSTIDSKIQDFITSAYVLAGSPASRVVQIFVPTNQN